MKWIKEPLKVIIIGAMAINIALEANGSLYWFLPSPLKYWIAPFVVIALAFLYRKLYNSKK